MKDLYRRVSNQKQDAINNKNEDKIEISNNNYNQHFIYDFHSDNIENGEFNFDSNYILNTKHVEQDEVLYSEKIRCKRILIEFSLIILILSILVLFGYFFILKRNIFDIDLILQTKTKYFHCHFISLYAIWILVSRKI